MGQKEMEEKINRILFATDFSDEADHALDYALTIAKRMEAKLILFHSIPEVFDFATRSERILEEETEEVIRKFKKLIKNLKENEQYKDLDLDFSVKTGRTVTNLDTEAVNQQADLIVMGYLENEEASTLKKALFGNVTSDVILSAEVPVLAVPLQSWGCDLKRIVFASNYQETDSRILDFVTSLADEFVSEVDIVHVDKEETEEGQIAFEEFRDEINTTVTDYHFTFEHLIDEDFGRALSEYLKKKDADLLVMGRKKRNFLQYIFTMGEAKELTFCKKVPLLVMPVED